MSPWSLWTRRPRPAWTCSARPRSIAATPMPGPRRRYRFVISESFTPDTMPMWRLAEYLAELSVLLGEKSAVHFVAMEPGSAVVIHDVEHEAYPKVRSRVHAVRRGEGAPDAKRAYDTINKKLAEDNTSGTLIEEPSPDEAVPARVLEFPGRKRFVELEYGPMTQPATLQGVVIAVGGEGDPVPVHLQDGNTTHNCLARIPVSKELAKHYRGNPVRVQGSGRWVRDADGQWLLRSFRINTFIVLHDDSLSTVVAKLRQVPGTWKEQQDVSATLRALRTGEG